MAKVKLTKFRLQSTSTASKTDPLFIYELGNFKRFSYDINSPVSPAPLPEEDSDENILLKIEGNSSQISLAWKIKDESLNRLITNNSESGDGDYYFPSNGSTKTVQEQVHFIRKFFRAASIDDAYQLEVEYDSSDPSKNLIFLGTFSQFHFDTAELETLTLNATCKFLEGNVQALYELDVASPPQNFVASSSTSQTLTYNWDVPLTSGSSAITGYNLYYAKLGQSYQKYFHNSTSTSKTISDTDTGVNIDANTEYRTYLKAITLVGEGQPSRVRNIQVS